MIYLRDIKFFTRKYNMFKKIVIALCFFTGLCDGNASRHSAISDQNTIKQCIPDTTLTRNFSNLNEIREKIKNEIIQKTNSDKACKKRIISTTSRNTRF